MKELTKGIWGVYKPVGVTSHDVVAMVRRQFRGERVGHAGTLDPLAQGVLVIAIGREYTKQLRHVVETDKEYIATVRLGLTSETDDAEGIAPEQLKDFAQRLAGGEIAQIPTLEQVEEVLPQFLGEIRQMPPAYSAVKIRGQEAYKRARAGEHFALGGRDIRIDSIEILDYKYPIIKLRVITGSGAYIRSLARDIGTALGTGAYLSGLIRTRVGQYLIDDALKLDVFCSKKDKK